MDRKYRMESFILQLFYLISILNLSDLCINHNKQTIRQKENKEKQEN